MILQDFYDGKAFDAYEFFGAHMENGKAVFRTYAPNAVSIQVIGNFNGWKGDEMNQTVIAVFLHLFQIKQSLEICISTK